VHPLLGVAAVSLMLTLGAPARAEGQGEQDLMARRFRRSWWTSTLTGSRR